APSPSEPKPARCDTRARWRRLPLEWCMDALKRAKRKFWIAMAVTIALVIGIASTWGWWTDGWITSSIASGSGEGSLLIGFNPDVGHRDIPKYWQWGRHSQPHQWSWTCLWPQQGRMPSRRIHSRAWYVSLPLWPLFLPSAIIALRAHRAVRRLSRAGCKHCGYSRVGLAAGVPCPECGAAS